MDEFFFIREIKTETGDAKFEPMFVRGQACEQGIILENGISLYCPFKLSSFKFGDIFLVTYNEDTQELLPYPRTPQEADAAQDPNLLDAAQNRKNWARNGAEKLITAVQEMRAAITEGRLTDALIHKWGELRQQFIDATTNALNKIKFKVNFTATARIYTPVELRSDAEKKTMNTKAFVDTGADVSVVHPRIVRELHLVTHQKGIIEGITDGTNEVDLVAVTVTLPNGFSKEVTAAVYAPVREKTGADFLVGADFVLKAKEAGVNLI